MKEVIVKSPYDCLIKNKEEQTILSAHESLILTSPFEVSVYPLERAIAFVLSSEKLTTCDFFDCIDYDGKTLVCLKSSATCENFNIVKLNGCRLEIGERKFVVKTENWKKIILLPCKFEKYQTSIKNNILLVKFAGQVQLMYAFNLKTSQAHTFSGDNIEFSTDGFKVENRGKLSSYKISSLGLSEEQKEKTITPLSSNTLAYHFLNHIKKEHLSDAHSLLDESLKNNISKSALKSFFGNIKNFFYLSPKCYAVQNEKGLKVYRFEIKQDKIVDISD